MRVIPGLVCLLLLVYPRIASGQAIVLHGSAGPTLIDTGHSLAAGVGFSPASHVTFCSTSSGRISRAGCAVMDEAVSPASVVELTLAAGELRVSVFDRDRVGPYGLAGFAAGVSRPNVNEQFPQPVTNDVRAVFFGGGIHVPLKDRISVFADGRMMIGAEAGELLAVAPVRAGVAWRF